MISYRCLHSVRLHHLSPQTNSLILWTVNVNTRLAVNSPASAKRVCPQAKNNSVRSFIPALLQSLLMRFMSYIEICSYPMYLCAFFYLLCAFTVSILAHKRRHIPIYIYIFFYLCFRDRIKTFLRFSAAVPASHIQYILYISNIQRICLNTLIIITYKLFPFKFFSCC